MSQDSSTDMTAKRSVFHIGMLQSVFMTLAGHLQTRIHWTSLRRRHTSLGERTEHKATETKHLSKRLWGGGHQIVLKYCGPYMTPYHMPMGIAELI